MPSSEGLSLERDMAELVFKRRKLKLNFYGEEVLINYPTLSKYEEYEKVTKGDKDNTFEAMINFLVSLGIREELIKDAEPEHVKEIMEVLSGVKKK